MALSTRSTRRSAANALSTPINLTNLDRLILAQAVHELGANSWPAVAKLLSKHPLLSRPKSFFTAQSCHTMYLHLIKEAGLECTEANNAPQAPVNLKLAQRHYQARVLELRNLILAEETEFKAIVAEIDEIRAGLWDDKIKSKLDPTSQEGQPEGQSTHNKDSPSLGIDIPPIAEEVFGSELSGMTDTSSAPKLLQQDEPPHKSTATATKIDEGESESIPDVPEVLQIGGELQETEHSAETPSLPTVDNAGPLPETQSLTGQHSPNVQSLDGEHPVAAEDQNEERVEVNEPLKFAARSKPPSASSVTTSNGRTRGLRQHEASPKIPPPELLFADGDESMVEPDEPKVETPHPEEQLFSPAPEAMSLRRREGKRKASIGDAADFSRERKRNREESETVEDDDQGAVFGPTRRKLVRQAPSENQVLSKRFQNVIGMLHSQISQHRNGNIFHNPIKDSEAPDYHDIVKRPIDLKTIKMRIKDGAISNSLEYQRDIFLMFANALMYNRPGSDIYNMAEDMMHESEGYIQTFRQTEGFVRGNHRV